MLQINLTLFIYFSIHTYIEHIYSITQRADSLKKLFIHADQEQGELVGYEGQQYD